MRTTIARCSSELEPLRELWQTLYRPAEHTLFQSFEWNFLAARWFAAREAPLVVCAEGENGAAIIPAAVDKKGRLTLLGETLFDYRDVLAAGDPEVLWGVWEKLSASGLGVGITALRGQRPEWTPLAPHPFCQAPAVTASGVSAEAFVRRHRGIGRYVRKLERAGAVVKRYDGSAGALIRSIMRRKCEYGGTDNLLCDPVRVDFLVAVAAKEPQQTDIFTLEAGGHLVAALLTYRDAGWRRFYTIHYEPAWAAYSPGSVLLFEVTRNSLAEGLNCDYMTGEHPYKMRFATGTVPLFRIDLSAAEFARAVGERQILPRAA